MVDGSWDRFITAPGMGASVYWCFSVLVFWCFTVLVQHSAGLAGKGFFYYADVDHHLWVWRKVAACGAPPSLPLHGFAALMYWVHML